MPFISHMATRPSLCCQTMSVFPSPLKSPRCRTFQPLPGPSRPPPPLRFTPFISHTLMLPSVCFQRMSLLPSKLKSPRSRVKLDCSVSNFAIQSLEDDIVTLPSVQSASPFHRTKKEPTTGVG